MKPRMKTASVAIVSALAVAVPTAPTAMAAAPVNVAGQSNSVPTAASPSIGNAAAVTGLASAKKKRVAKKAAPMAAKRRRTKG